MLSACKGNQPNETSNPNGIETLDFNTLLNSDHIPDMANMLKEVKFIPLETNEKCLLPDYISKITHFGDRFVLHNFKEGLYIFKDDGSFVKQIFNGNGPGEIIPDGSPAIAFNEKDQTIVVAQLSGIINWYTIDGEYIKSINFEKRITGFEFLKDCAIITYDEGFKKEHISKYDFELNNMLFDTSFARTFFDIINTGTLHKENDSTILWHRNNYCKIERLCGNTLDAAMILDISSNQLEKTGFNEITSSDIGKWQYEGNYNKAGEWDLFYFMKILEIKEGVSLLPMAFFRNITSGNIYPINASIMANYYIMNVKCTADDYFVTYLRPFNEKTRLTPDSVFSQTECDKWNNYNEDDNPFIVLYKLKEK